MIRTSERAQNARAQLERLCPRGTTVYTVLRSTVRSGMSRRIDLYVIVDGEPVWISGYAALMLGLPQPDDGIRVNGCGMDIGFALVYDLSCALHCPGTYDHDSAYSLKHRWL